jgi:glutathione peroxidase
MRTKMILTIIVLLLAVAGGFAYYLRSNGNVKENAGLKSSSIHRFKVTALDGSTINFADFKGKKIMVVNTASKCGLTPQYEGLESLYKKYGDRLIIVGFPSNDFLFQEPGTNADIAAFCQRNYGVSFPMAAKVEVKGKNQAPVYQWLTNKNLNGVESSAITWNFQKYLIDERGKLVQHFSPKTDPEDPEIIKWIESGD